MWRSVISILFCFLSFLGQCQFEALAAAAEQIVDPRIRYDPNYRVIDYPLGDVPSGTGVCTDVVIRAYRKIGIDLQQLVHEDMERSFGSYPKNWGLSKPDPNIDHRRVPNLMTFFGRHGKTLNISNQASDFLPGEIVCWDLGSGILHIGLVSSTLKNDQNRYLILHNIGGGQVLEDVLFEYRVIGHYRYEGPE